MVGAFDLDDDSGVVKADIEVDAATWPSTNDLPTGLRQAAPAAQRGEVELTHRLDAVDDVGQDAPNDRVSSVA